MYKLLIIFVCLIIVSAACLAGDHPNREAKQKRAAESGQPAQTSPPPAPAPAPAAPAPSVAAPAAPVRIGSPPAVYTPPAQPARPSYGLGSSSHTIVYSSGPPSAPSNPARVSAGSGSESGRRFGEHPNRTERGTTVSAPQPPRNTSYNPGDRRQPGGYSTVGGTHPAGYYPSIKTRTPDPDPGSTRTTRQEPARGPDRPSETPGHSPPGSGYRPGGSSRPSNPSPADTTHKIMGGASSGGYRPGVRTHSTAYAPKGTLRSTGYHPGATHYVPRGYTPPTYRQGHFHYSTAYCPRPCSYGYWAFDYYPGFSWKSVYFHFGYFPYVQVSRVTEVTYVNVTYVTEPLYVSGGTYYYNSRYAGLDLALADVRSAWVGARFDLIERHVRLGSTIAILLDGEYDYSITADDYLSMTRDALIDLDTISFVWDKVRERQDGTVTAYGEHRFYSSDVARTVYVTYTLRRIGGDYYVTEIGSSSSPL